MSIKKTALNFIYSVFNKIKSILPSDFWKNAKKLINKTGSKIVYSIAMEAVSAAESRGGSGSDKFEAAYDSISNTFRREGIPLIENSIRLLIEGAVANLKAK